MRKGGSRTLPPSRSLERIVVIKRRLRHFVERPLVGVTSAALGYSPHIHEYQTDLYRIHG